MAKVLLGATGSVAAIRVPSLYADLKEAGHQVKIIATASSLYFFDPEAIEPLPEGGRNREVVILDEDEWPGESYQRGQPVLHIELRKWADAMVIAPLDANTLAKMACGLSDNCLTCTWRAWDREKPIILAPAMNTLMWDHPFTIQHLQRLAELEIQEKIPDHLSPEECTAWINSHCRLLRIVQPQVKTLACGDVGAGGIAENNAILAVLKDLF